VVEVEVVKKSRRGVAKVEGSVVFVPGAEPGQGLRY
jgi:predicted RNA-binding protein with TRAM domain